MPNATVRANARTLPEPTEAHAEHEGFSKIEAFGRAYARWLTARAQLEDLKVEENAVDGLFIEERAALRGLFLVPAVEHEAVWAKLAAFEVDLAKEMIGGPSKDCILLLGLGSIKADIMNLGIKEGDI